MPLDLAEARNAIELARMAGANCYASDTFMKAARLLAEAEIARESGALNEVLPSAGNLRQTSEDARRIA